MNRARARSSRAFVQRLADGGDREHRVAQLGRVTAADGDQHVGDRGLLQGVEPAGGPEVQQAQTAVVEQPHVAGMRVGVEPLAQHHQPQRGAEQDVGELVLIDPGPLQPSGIRHAGAVQPFHHQHPRRAELVEDGRDADLRDVGQPGGHLGHVAGFGAEIEFGAEVAGELGGQVTDPVGGPPRGAGLDHAGQPAQDGQVAVDRLGDLRALDLDDDLLPARQDGQVGLGDGASRDRDPVELGEGLGHRPPDLLLHQRPHRPGVRRRDVFLQTGELAGQARGDDIGPGGQHLTQLDEHAAGFIQSQAGLPGGIGRLVRPSGAVPEAEIGTEPVPDGDTDDLQVAAGTPGRPPDGPHRMRQRDAKRRGRGTFPRPDRKLPASRGDHGENDHEDDRVPGEPWCPGIPVSHQQGQCPAGEESGETADQDADPGPLPHTEKAARQPGHKQYRDQVPQDDRGGEQVDRPGGGRACRQAGYAGPPAQSLIHVLTPRSGRAGTGGRLACPPGMLPALPLVPIPAQPTCRPQTGCPHGPDLDAFEQLLLHRGVPAAVTFALLTAGTR